MWRRVGGMCVMFLVAGCATGPMARQQPIPQGPPPTAHQIITHLNHNAQLVQSIESQQVNIQVKQGNQPAGLDGMLAYQKPRSFRLMAEAARSSQADFGSNDTEFWFWVKKGNPNELYRCSYQDFPQCKNLRLPIHPEWIAEALCVSELRSPDKYQVRAAAQTLELVSDDTTPQGEPVQKVTVVGRDNGRIRSHHLRTPQGKEIWSAYVDEYQNVGGVILPRKVRVVCPEEKMEMTLKLDRCKVNSIPARSGELFVRPDMPGVQTVDLARGPAHSTQSIQKVRGTGGN